jgi:hypothetical protein
MRRASSDGPDSNRNGVSCTEQAALKVTSANKYERVGRSHYDRVSEIGKVDADRAGRRDLVAGLVGPVEGHLGDHGQQLRPPPPRMLLSGGSRLF